MHRGYIRPTAEEQRRIDVMMGLGCVACAYLGVPNLQFTECHHIVEGNRRMGHLYTLPLCAGHHRGIWTLGQLTWIPEELLVSISSGRKVFVATYDTERNLWVTVEEKMKLPTIWPESKVLPRRIA